jgi:hypothetical protein
MTPPRVAKSEVLTCPASFRMSPIKLAYHSRSTTPRLPLTRAAMRLRSATLISSERDVSCTC